MAYLHSTHALNPWRNENLFLVFKYTEYHILVNGSVSHILVLPFYCLESVVLRWGKHTRTKTLMLKEKTCTLHTWYKMLNMYPLKKTRTVVKINWTKLCTSNRNFWVIDFLYHFHSGNEFIHRKCAKMSRFIFTFVVL